MLASETFKRVQDKAKGFLGFVVAKKLLGRSDEIKEMTIAMSVYGENSDYDPAVSTKIRVAASSLRSKLLDYQTGEGRNDPIEIRIPKGTYVPEIRERWPSLAVGLFQNWSPQRDQDYLCVAVRDEIAHCLGQAGGVSVKPVAEIEADGSCRYGLRGSLECWDDMLRLNVSLCDRLARRIVFAQVVEGRRDDVLKLSRQVAESVLRIVSVVRKPVAAVRLTRAEPNTRPAV